MAITGLFGNPGAMGFVDGGGERSLRVAAGLTHLILSGERYQDTSEG